MEAIKKIEWWDADGGVLSIGQTPEPYRLTWQVFAYEPGRFQVFTADGECLHGDGGLAEGKAVAEKHWRDMVLAPSE